MPAKTILLGIIAASQVSCTGASGPGEQACGESFCVIGTRQGDLAKASPVEDFNLYRLQAGRATFDIYEGNAPPTSGATIERIRVDSAEWELRREGNRLTARIFRQHLRWPQYLVVTMHCEDVSTCSLRDFLRDIDLRDPGY